MTGAVCPKNRRYRHTDLSRNKEQGRAPSCHVGTGVHGGASRGVQDTVEVNGPGADPLYKYLKATAPVSIPGSAFTRTSDLLWNYEKFLCDQDGVPVKRFKSPFNPADFEGDVRPPDPTQLFCPDPLHPNCSKVPLMTSFVSFTPTSPMHRRPDRRPSWLHVLVVFRASMQHLVLSCQDARMKRRISMRWCEI